MRHDSDDAERLMLSAWAIVARAIVPEAGPDRDYLNELAAALKPGQAHEVVAEARAILTRWKNHPNGETDREYLDELLALMSGPTAIAVAKSYAIEQMQPPRPGPKANGNAHPAAEVGAPLTPQVKDVVTSSLVGHTVSEVERDLIIDTLDKVGGNRTLAATLLGISLRTLRNKLHQYAGEGLAVPKRGDHRSAR